MDIPGGSRGSSSVAHPPLVPRRLILRVGALSFVPNEGHAPMVAQLVIGPPFLGSTRPSSQILGCAIRQAVGLIGRSAACQATMSGSRAKRPRRPSIRKTGTWTLPRRTAARRASSVLKPRSARSSSPVTSASALAADEPSRRLCTGGLHVTSAANPELAETNGAGFVQRLRQARKASK